MWQTLHNAVRRREMAPGLPCGGARGSQPREAPQPVGPAALAISVRLDPDKLKLMLEYKPEAPSVPVATEAHPTPAKPH